MIKKKFSYKLLGDVQVNFKSLAVNEANLDIVESYKIGLSYIFITSDGKYLIKDPPINQSEIDAMNNIINDLLYKLPSVQVEDKGIFKNTLKNFGIYDNKLIYFLERELFGFGILDPIMKDPKVEDVQIPSPNVSARVVHSDYGKLTTNVVLDENELDLYIEKMVYKSGKSVSMFKPMLSIRASDTARITVTYKREVGYKGSSITIRKFPENPWSITRMLCKNTLDIYSTAYLMTLIENKKAVLVIGGMGDGKTSLINSLTNFIPHNSTVITVEDSVCKDAYIICKIDEEIKILKIGELVDNLFKKYNKESEGFLKVHNLSILTLNDKNEIVWKKCDYVYKHTVQKEFVKILTETGKEIKVTADHSLFRLEETNNVLIPIKCSLLKPGDYVAVVANLNIKINENGEQSLHAFFAKKNNNQNIGFDEISLINRSKTLKEYNKYKTDTERIKQLLSLIKFKLEDNWIKVKNKDDALLFQTLLLFFGIESSIVFNEEENKEEYKIVIHNYTQTKESAKASKPNCIRNEKIIKVEKQFKKETVYDLTVLESGKFIANNFICHNTPELRLAHPYWIPLVTRESITLDEKGNIDMFSLVKHALRMSGDYLIVGEVRGEEGRVWAQAIMTGHGGITSLHAESPTSAIERLLTEPINVDAGSLASLHSIIDIRKISQYKENDKGKRILTFHRRIVGIYDLDYSTNTKQSNLFKVTSYDGNKDSFNTISFEEMLKLPSISQIMVEKGLDETKMLKLLEQKANFLGKIKELALNNDEYLDYNRISKVIWEFNKDPFNFKLDLQPRKFELVLE